MNERLLAHLDGIFVGVFAVLAIIYVAIKIYWERKPGVEKHLFKRFSNNPALSPRLEMDWEGQGTCNSAALIDDTGKVHILYRAIGNDGVSRFGYASSEDGFVFGNRSIYPVFFLQKLETSESKIKAFDPVLYPSGGSWGGAEDPRMVEIEDRIYVNFSAFSDWNYIRLAVTSISKKDFLSKKWNWSNPVFISPVGEINKNWVLFPEKINGKFAILHSVTPNPQVNFVDKLEFLDNGAQKITSNFRQKIPRKTWDTWVRGSGPPPIKTSKGWLVLYHANSKEEPHKYQVGAMLLDINDPNIIIARSPSAILLPDKWYENDWKPGIVYVCGAVIKNGELLVYYGGGDKHVCVAETNLNKLLEWLLTHGRDNLL
jgi:predicted GH43/DUF377 family glycosyl hydrolase